jgi:hypothetical protein
MLLTYASQKKKCTQRTDDGVKQQLTLRCDESKREWVDMKKKTYALFACRKPQKKNLLVLLKNDKTNGMKSFCSAF